MEMPEKYDTLRRSLRIHLTALHKDAQEQPELADQAGELAASLKAEARRRRIDVDEAKGRANISIRQNPGQYGLDKVTETAVTACVPIHPDVVKSVREAVDADELADKAAALAEAYHHRKSMIQDEVKLYLGNYFGEAEVKDMGQAEREVIADKVDRAEAQFAERRRRRDTGEA